MTQQMREGDNQLVVCVIDASDDRNRYGDAPFSEVPHGKQSWYGPIGGIWQSVWLEKRASIHLQRLQLQPDVATASIAIHASCNLAQNSSLPVNATIQVSVFDPNDEKVADGTLIDGSLTLPIALSPIALWSPETPNLYTVTATLLVDGQPVDQLTDHCGFRTIEGRWAHLSQRQASLSARRARPAYYPGTIYTAQPRISRRSGAKPRR